MSKHRHGKGKFRRMQKMQQQTMMQQQPGVMQQQNQGMMQQPGVVQPSASNMPMAPQPKVSTPVQQPPALPKKAVAAGAIPLHYEYVAGDLRMIGILTAICVVILVVLYIFLK